MWQCLYFQIYKRFQIIEDGMTGPGPHYYMHEMRGREIISIYCDCGTGLIMHCICGVDLMWCEILLFGSIFSILFN